MPRSVLGVVHRQESRETRETRPNRWFGSRALYGTSTYDEASEANWSAVKGAALGAVIGASVNALTNQNALTGAIRGGVALGTANFMNTTANQRAARAGEKRHTVDKVLRGAATLPVAYLAAKIATGGGGMFGTSRDHVPPRSVLQVVNRGEAGSQTSQTSRARQESWSSHASGAYKRIRTPVYGDSTSDEASEANRIAVKGALVGAMVGGLDAGRKEDNCRGQAAYHRQECIIGGAIKGAFAGGAAGFLDATQRQRDMRSGVATTGVERVVRSVATAAAVKVAADSVIGAAFKARDIARDPQQEWENAKNRCEGNDPDGTCSSDSDNDSDFAEALSAKNARDTRNAKTAVGSKGSRGKKWI